MNNFQLFVVCKQFALDFELFVLLKDEGRFPQVLISEEGRTWVDGRAGFSTYNLIHIQYTLQGHLSSSRLIKYIFKYSPRGGGGSCSTIIQCTPLRSQEELCILYLMWTTYLKDNSVKHILSRTSIAVKIFGFIYWLSQIYICLFMLIIWLTES